MNSSDSQAQLSGFAALRSYWRKDLLASLWVTLLALPFCLSLAFAAGFPLSSALLSMLIGAIFWHLLSSSPLGIKSTSLSMSAVFYLAMSNLSHYQYTGMQYALAALVLAGAIQFLFGLMRLGSLSSMIPEAIVYGLLTAAALMIFSRQVHYLLGVVPNSRHSLSLLLEVPHSIWRANPDIMSIGLISLLILFLPSWLRWDIQGGVPRAFLVLLFGIASSFYLGLTPAKHSVFLLPLPQSFSDWLIFPDFSKINIWLSIEYTFTIALIGILEGIVNIRSIESLDVYRRQSKPNRELMLLGLGNMLCGLVGGLPLMTNIGESALYINNSGKTFWGNLFKVALLSVALLITWQFLAYVPLASLAAILIYVIYRLNSPHLFRAVYEVGWEQLLIFVSTLLGALILGLIAGLGIGLGVTLLVYLYLGAPLTAMLNTKVHVSRPGRHKIKLDIYGAALASNYLSVHKHLKKAQPEDRIILDFSRAKVVAHSFLEQVYDFAHLHHFSDGRIELQGLKKHQPISRHPLSTLYRQKRFRKRKYLWKRSKDERQIDLQGLAAVNNARLEKNLSYDGVVLLGFNFALGYEIKYRENKFMRFYGGSNTIEFCDVFLSRGLRLNEQNHKMSVVLTTVMGQAVPDFILSRETLLAKVIQTIGYEDIDFEEHPTFSETFLLQGADEAAIRAFFQPDLLNFLEEHPYINIEAKHNRILLFRDRNLLNRTEIEDLIDITEQFLDLIAAAPVLR